MSEKPEGGVGVQLRPKVLAPPWTCFPILRDRGLPICQLAGKNG